ncbi:MAG TPA: FHA domain-containing protein [Planctomycetota bacterium]
MARLILESGGERRETRITGPVTIGRSPSATFPIDDKTLSREHTLISGQRGHYTVKDLESKNGTYLNGKLIKQPEALKHGDRVKVGPATFMIVWDPEDSAAERQAPAPAARPVSRPATRREPAVASGGAGIARFFSTIIALGVFVVGTWFAKQLVIQFLFPRIPQ